MNAAAEEGIFDTTLGLLEKERRLVIVGKGHSASEIMFGEAKREQWRCITSLPACLSPLYTRRTRTTASQWHHRRRWQKSVFSVGTSKITSDGSDEEETDEDEGPDYKEESATKTPAV